MFREDNLSGEVREQSKAEQSSHPEAKEAGHQEIEGKIFTGDWRLLDKEFLERIGGLWRQQRGELVRPKWRHLRDERWKRNFSQHREQSNVDEHQEDIVLLESDLGEAVKNTHELISALQLIGAETRSIAGQGVAVRPARVAPSESHGVRLRRSSRKDDEQWFLTIKEPLTEKNRSDGVMNRKEIEVHLKKKGVRNVRRILEQGAYQKYAEREKFRLVFSLSPGEYFYRSPEGEEIVETLSAPATIEINVPPAAEGSLKPTFPWLEVEAANVAEVQLVNRLLGFSPGDLRACLDTDMYREYCGLKKPVLDNLKFTPSEKKARLAQLTAATKVL